MAGSRRGPASARGQPAGAAVRRLYLAGIHARRGARVHQPVEYAAARAGAVPRHPIRGESVEALVNRLIVALRPQSVRRARTDSSKTHAAPAVRLFDGTWHRRQSVRADVSALRRGSHQMGRVAFRGLANGYIANLDVVHTGGFREVGSEWISDSFAIALRCRCLRPRGRRVDGRGALAVADPGLGGSAPNGDDDGTNKPIGGGPTAGSPVGSVTDTVRGTIQGVTAEACLGRATRPAAFDRRDEHTGFGPATRPAAFHRRG